MVVLQLMSRRSAVVGPFRKPMVVHIFSWLATGLMWVSLLVMAVLAF
ncbi:hypothetical protein [Cupriavidus sp. D384]|nr:hypothetical protein [Cupriavidus sp. D384]